jgi:hypothetical protein
MSPVSWRILFQGVHDLDLSHGNSVGNRQGLILGSKPVLEFQLSFASVGHGRIRSWDTGAAGVRLQYSTWVAR